MNKETRQRLEKEVQFGEMFQTTDLYKLLKQFDGDIDNPLFKKIETEINNHPEYGFKICLRKDMEGECLVMKDHFVIDSNVMRGCNWFLFYEFGKYFDFDEDLQQIKDALAA